MTLRALLACVLTLLMTGVPMSASSQTPPEDWHAVAEGLPPQALVSVRLVDGTRVQGYLMDVTADTIVVQPKTRLRVAPRTIDLASVRSLAPAKMGASPGARVVKLVGAVSLVIVVAGTVILVAALRSL
jgi:hypothetical protein